MAQGNQIKTIIVLLYMTTAYSNKGVIMTVREDAYLTAVSLELSPEHGMMSVSVYLTKKLSKYRAENKDLYQIDYLFTFF